MGHHLRRSPVHVRERGRAKSRGSQTPFAHQHRSNVDLDVEVESARVPIRLGGQIGQRLRIAGRTEESRDPVRLERFPGNHPWRDRSREALRQKWTEWLILPRLDVACRPVVDQTYAEDMVFRFADRDRLAHFIPAAYEKTDLS